MCLSHAIVVRPCCLFAKTKSANTQKQLESQMNCLFVFDPHSIIPTNDLKD